MNRNANRLLELVDLLAKLIKDLTQTKVLSYHDIAKQTGLSKNVIYYFAAQSESRGDGPSSIKASALARLLDWFEKTDFNSPAFSKEQGELASRIHGLLDSSNYQSGEGYLRDVFSLNTEQTSQLQELFPKLLIGVRQRGTSELFQVSIHQICRIHDPRFVHWRMVFLQGEKSISGKVEFRKDQQEGREISGFASVEGRMVTCVGQQKGSTSLSLMNIVFDPAEAFGEKRLLQAVFCSYSRNEAIARRMLLFDSNLAVDSNMLPIVSKLGDFSAKDLVAQYPDISESISRSFLGFSLEPGGYKIHPRPLSEFIEGHGW